MDFSEVVARRYSCRQFDPARTISDAEVGQILALTLQSPSSYNLQHWRFIVVRDPARKKALRAAAWDQEQVETCSAVIAVCAAIDAHRDAANIFRDAPQQRRDALVPMIQGFYEGNPQLMRDEAMRSASLAAMTLMLAAADRGWDSCPMVGFDPLAVADILELPDAWLIGMLLPIGKGQGDTPPRMRLPLREVATWETATGTPFAHPAE